MLQYISKNLSTNEFVFRNLFAGTSKEEYLWKPDPEKWCLLEVLCHLYDEEREDFRARVKHVLENADKPMAGIDPQAWVTERSYRDQDYEEMLEKFLTERTRSVEWLNSLSSPQWENTYDHPKLGKVTAIYFLSNWLAHDYLHLRQILKLKHGYLQQMSSESLDYAGKW